MGLLVADDPVEAERLADELESVHRRRRELTVTALAEARRAVADDADMPEGKGALVVRHDDWEPGLIGLLAGRLRGRAGQAGCGGHRRGAGAAWFGAGTGRLPRGRRARGLRCPSHEARRPRGCGRIQPRRRMHGTGSRRRSGPCRVRSPSGAARMANHRAAWPSTSCCPRRASGGRSPTSWRACEPYGPGNTEPVLAVTGLLVGDARQGRCDGGAHRLPHATRPGDGRCRLLRRARGVGRFRELGARWIWWAPWSATVTRAWIACGSGSSTMPIPRPARSWRVAVLMPRGACRRVPGESADGRSGRDAPRSAARAGPRAGRPALPGHRPASRPVARGAAAHRRRRGALRARRHRGGGAAAQSR